MELTVALDGEKKRDLRFFAGDDMSLTIVVYAHDGDVSPIAVTNVRFAAADGSLPMGSEFVVPSNFFGRVPYRIVGEVADITTTLAYGVMQTEGGWPSLFCWCAGPWPYGVVGKSENVTVLDKHQNFESPANVESALEELGDFKKTAGDLSHAVEDAQQAADEAAASASNAAETLAGSLTKTAAAAADGSTKLGTQLADWVDSTYRTQAQKNGDVVTPFDAGAVGDGVADDTVALEKFFAWTITKPAKNFQVVGKFKIIRAIAVDYAGIRCSIMFAATIISAIPDMVDVLTVSNSPLLSMRGWLGIQGNGGTTYSSRKNLSGLVVNNCTRFSADTIRCDYFLRDGVRLLGTTSQPFINYLQAWYCGSAAIPTSPLVGWHTTAGTVGARESTSGSTTQKQALTLVDALPAYVDTTGWFLRIRSGLYKITDITDPLNVKVYPWLDDNTVPTDAVDLIGGSAVYSIGGDVSAGRIGTLDALVCGIGMQSLSLYPISVGNFVSQTNGMSAVYGSAINAALTSCTWDYFYSELDTFGLVYASLAASQLYIGTTLTFPADRSFRMAPRLTGNALSTAFIPLGPGVSWMTDNGRAYGTSMGALGSDNTNQTVRIEGTGAASYTIGQSTTGITLTDPATINKVTGARAIEVVALGTGTNQAHTSNLTFTPPATHTINGGAAGVALTFAGMTKPAIFKIMWAGGTAWRIAKFDAAIAASKGTTAQRPTLAVGDAGTLYLDTTLAAAGKTIWWTGTAWVDATGATV